MCRRRLSCWASRICWSWCSWRLFGGWCRSIGLQFSRSTDVRAALRLQSELRRNSLMIPLKIECSHCNANKLGLTLSDAVRLAANEKTVMCPECSTVGRLEFRQLFPVLSGIPVALFWLSPITTSAVLIDGAMLAVWLFFVVRHTFRMVRVSASP